MKTVYTWVILIALLFLLSFGGIYALNGVKSTKLPWQGTANGFYDATHNAGWSNLADSRFTLSNSNTIVTDSITGLQWQSFKNTGSADYLATGTGHANAKTYCAGLNLGWYPTGSWRMPTIKEMSSISDLSVNAAIGVNATYFGAQNGNYWSTNNYITDTSYALVIQPTGGIYFSSKTSNNYIRCVH